MPATQMTFDAANRLATFNGQTITHDLDGNMVSGPLPKTGAMGNYTYDSRNRLTGAGGFAYRYNAEGNRVGLTSANETTTLTVDPQGALPKVLERVKNGVRTRYVYGAGLQYEVSDAGSATYYHYDQSGNTAALTNQAGAIIERVVYSPYGTIRYRQSNFDTPFLYGGFFGVMTDANGLIAMRARYYNPLTMRFLNSDPAMDGLNWYAYAGGNPINNSDPGGLSTVRIITDQGLTTLIDPTNQKFRDTVTAFSNGSINKIEIVGHGSSEQMYIEPGSSGHGVVYVQGVTQGIVFTDDGTSLSGLLKPKLSVDANIQLNGCNTAREWTSSSNENIAKQLSHELPGVSVTGNRGFGIGNEMSNPLNRDQYIRFGQENHAVGITRTYKTNK